MMNVSKQSLLLFALHLFSLQVIAQLPGHKNFLFEKDNRQVKINTLFKNTQGYLFAGTDEGLYKFDGDKYSVINFENENYNDTVTAIFNDKKNKMWVGFRSGRIANVINKRLVYFNPEEGTPKKKITAFIQDKEDNIWFSANGEGIYILKNKRLYLINAEDGLADQNVSTLMLTDNGDVLAGTDEGMYICSFKNGKKQLTVIDPRNGLPDYIVTSITRASENKYWIGLQEKGFCLYDHVSKKITIPEPAKNWKWGQVNSMLLAQNCLWLAIANQGIFKYCPSQNKLNKMQQQVAGKDFTNLLEDNQGNVWMTSAEFGMVRTPGESLKILPIPGSPIFEHVHVLLCEKNGNTWLNNEWNDLIKIDNRGDTMLVKKIRLSGLNERTDITSLYQDEFDNIWVGTMGKGVFVLNPESFDYRLIDDKGSFSDAGILSISGSQHSIYISSLQGSMVITLTPENKNLHELYNIMDFDSKSTGTNYIYNIFKDSKNRVWFATDGMGLTKFEQNRFTYYNNKQQIKDNRIYSITEDRKGNIWFSTAGAGIYKYDGKSFVNYGLNEGLSNLKISVVKADRAGNIIIVNKKGLDILNPETGNIFYVTASQGISTVNAEDIGAVTLDTSGNIMVSTLNGILTYTYPENTIQKPTVLIESVQLFLKDIDDSASHTFNHDENNLRFNYTGLYYTDPEKIYYKYKMEGLDSNWVITRDRSKAFPRLDPGKYTFHIEASLNRNFTNASKAEYSFTIQKAFYKTWWFLSGCTVLLLSLVYWYIKSREKRLKRIAQQRQEKIQFQFEVLRNQVNPHFLFNSFNTLISTIEEEPEKAVEYTSQLSDFFRNVVTQQDNDTISLKNEIESLHSYFFLQQKRYGNSLNINIEMSEAQKLQYQIPPMALQLLMENAIKHNAVSNETPLFITIKILENTYIEIKNNINAKISKAAGTGMGLKNIINRYHLLSNKPVKILNDGQYFIVLLPLLN